MANEIDGATEAAVVTPELWRPKMLEGRYAVARIGPRVLSVEGDVSAKGDILHIPIEPTVSANAVTATTGAVTNQALTPTEAQLTVDKWYEATIDVVDRAQRQSIIDLLTAFVPAFSKALTQQQESDLASLYSDVTTNSVGANTDAITEDLLTAAVAKLLSSDVPVMDPNDVSFCFHTSVWAHLKKIACFNHANLTGDSMGGQLKAAVADIYGIPVYFSTQIASSGGARQNLLFHRQAFALGQQKNFRVETLARVRKSTPVSGDILYGVKTVREGHACVLKTQA